jgi:hypothetical protein
LTLLPFLDGAVGDSKAKKSSELPL